MYPYNEKGSSEPHNPSEKLLFRPSSSAHERLQANPTRQYILSLLYPPFGPLWVRQGRLHRCRRVEVRKMRVSESG